MFTKENNHKKPIVMERNILAKNTKIVGDLTSDGDFRIDGILEGTLETKGRVIIGLEGFVQGKVICENADVEGKFSGDLTVNKMLTLKASASVTGEIVLGKLSVEPGAAFNGSCTMKGALKELKSNEQAAIAKEKTA
ncbi:MAG: polymer-forming cytoskeletal protein [Polaribacter sp.]|nr:polymer-forming cytoskeletal protein [Polaribacter sp.]MDG1810745.1 polymer-forming cytoskeletal protein [Polaribacter sp.]